MFSALRPTSDIARQRSVNAPSRRHPARSERYKPRAAGWPTAAADRQMAANFFSWDRRVRISFWLQND
jgi:hypothetical protein